MILLKPFKSSFFVTLTYRRPILDYQGLPSRFFKFVFDTMTPQYQVLTSQLSVNNPPILGELEMKYNFFGGASSLTMTPDKLEFSFPVVVESDQELINDILRRIHDGLLDVFPECAYENVDLRDFLHAEMEFETLDMKEKDLPISTTKFLDHYKISGAENIFGGLGDFEQFSSGRFEIKALDKSWYCRVSVERSVLSPNGVFLDLLVRLEGSKMPISFSDKQEQIHRLRMATLATLGLTI